MEDDPYLLELLNERTILTTRLRSVQDKINARRMELKASVKEAKQIEYCNHVIRLIFKNGWQEYSCRNPAKEKYGGECGRHYNKPTPFIKKLGYATNRPVTPFE